MKNKIKININGKSISLKKAMEILTEEYIYNNPVSPETIVDLVNALNFFSHQFSSITEDQLNFLATLGFVPDDSTAPHVGKKHVAY